jgi:translocation and assembly module TamB
MIEGRLSEPRLRFESDPELDETDIASYLLLGRPASASAGEDQMALEAVAAQVAVGAAIREFEKMFGGVLPVDLIDIRMDNEGDERELRAGVGKYVGDRLFIHYERGFGDEPDDELKAEYELTPMWSIESTDSSNGDTAGDIVFEIEY